MTILLSALIFAGCVCSEERAYVIMFEEGHPLVGIWELAESTCSFYTFDADGNGSQTIGTFNLLFTWEVCDEGHLILAFPPGNVLFHEHFYMRLEDNTLQITNKHNNGRQHIYIRRVDN